MAQTSFAVRVLAVLVLLPAAGCRPRVRVGTIPPPPVTFACAVNPAAVYPGDPVTVVASLENVDPGQRTRTRWRLDGAAVAGLGTSVAIATSGLAAGEHTVYGHVGVDDRDVPTGGLSGRKTSPATTADCAVRFVVRAFEPPTISCSANPAMVSPGETATISSVAVSPQNRPLAYSYAATAGAIAGTGATATLTTQGAFETIAVTCNAVDDRGQVASGTTTVTVQAPTAPPPPQSVAPRCSATPPSVPPGAGNVVRLAAAEGDVHAGEHLQWSFAPAPGALVDDTLDTGQLAPGSYMALGTILGAAFAPRSCTAAFTVDRHARAADWQAITQLSKLLVHDEQRSDREMGNFALYTYVLIRTLPTRAEDKLRLRNMVMRVLANGTEEGLVQATTPARSTPARGTHAGQPPRTVARPPAQTGVIYIPVKDVPDGGRSVGDQAAWIVDQEHYDLTTARRLLGQPACVRLPGGCRERLAGDGPFLVSTLIPLSAGHPPSALIQDFGGTTPEMADKWTGEFLRLAAARRNWTGYSLQRAAQDLTLTLDREGQAISQVGDARRSFVAMWLPGKK